MLKSAFHKLKVRHRTLQSLMYVQNCFELNLEPKFLKISEKSIIQIGLNKGEIFKFRKRRMKREKQLKGFPARNLTYSR